MTLSKFCCFLFAGLILGIFDASGAAYPQPEKLGFSMGYDLKQHPISQKKYLSLDVPLSQPALIQALYDLLLPPQSSPDQLQGPSEFDDVLSYFGELDLPEKEKFSLYFGDYRRKIILGENNTRREISRREPDLLRKLQESPPSQEAVFHLIPPRGARLWPTSEYTIRGKPTLFRSDFWIFMNPINDQNTRIQIFEETPMVLAGYTVAMSGHTFSLFKGYDWRNVEPSTKDPADIVDLLRKRAASLGNVTQPKIPSHALDWGKINKIIVSDNVKLDKLKLVQMKGDKAHTRTLHFSFDVVNGAQYPISEYMIGYGGVNPLRINYEIKSVNSNGRITVITCDENKRCNLSPFADRLVPKKNKSIREGFEIPPNSIYRMQDGLSLGHLEVGRYILSLRLENAYARSRIPISKLEEGFEIK